MKGSRALTSAALVLALICLVPAVSAAQQEVSLPETATTNPSKPAGPAPPSAPASDTGVPPADRKPADREGDGEQQTASQELAAPEQTRGEEQGATADARGSGLARKSATAVVTMDDFFFSPATVSVAVGDLVTWKNTGKEPHNAVADDGSFDTGIVTAGQRASRMFSKAGTFSYICTIHPQMKGTVRVLSSGGGGAGGTAGSSSGSGLSEEQAVNSPDAAGDENTLPMSGMAVGALALVGLALLGSGLLVKYWGRRTAGAGASRQLTRF